MRAVNRNCVRSPARPNGDAVGEIAGWCRLVCNGRRGSKPGDRNLCRRQTEAGDRLIRDADGIARRAVADSRGLVADHQHVATVAEIKIQVAENLIEIAPEEVGGSRSDGLVRE